MYYLVKIFIGSIVVFSGFFLGELLAKITKEELRAGQRWFKILLLLSFLGAIFSLLTLNDVILFTLLFIISITIKSIIINKNKKNKITKNLFKFIQIICSFSFSLPWLLPLFILKKRNLFF
ncbi:MAG: hypothetical protein QXU40_01850 [Candidatus Pacearchaeota archaeon]